MKKAILFMILTALLAAPVAGAVDRVPAVVEPSGVIVVVPQIAIDKAAGLEYIDIIHYKKGAIKPDQPGRKPQTESCYGFISGLAKLIETENLLVNPTNSGMAEADVLNAINISTLTWDNQTSAALFGGIVTDYAANFDSTADGQNEISFGNYSQSGVIAVARIWGYFSGKPSARYISQFDIMFDTDYQWGDGEFNPALMDLQNIATHELGHALGLADIYSSSCPLVTMYGYSTNGEIQKRTLEQPDINGLRTLYGI